MNESVDFVMKMVEGEKQHGISSDRVIIGGFSQVVNKFALILLLNPFYIVNNDFLSY